ncbi:hypothetical protein [Pseudomonas sp. P8_241]|uniref:hypothetical protein n=1 Tax=Pseudomonas sp. P8_241 TaxID=3043445 RepID=UPI002A35C252|nr:hypothetical protein [Pseudomonas sp. P8_241]WPN49112.1 hypothetical protein QMK58_10770 [Pseudomonas sp. P8_241]
MNRQLFELALNNTKASDWEYFENLCSGFLASEFSSLRTMASPSGDGGRDSELFSNDGNTYVATQYSVSKDWDAKVMRTIKRLEEGFDSIRVLIYLTNQLIGANGDALKQKCLQKGISLDIRDKNWFLERFESDDARYASAQVLVNIIALPILEGEKIIEKSRPALTSLESKAALTYLSMQWEDEATDKGLTKIVFESLVRAALRNSNDKARLTRDEIYQKVFQYMPSTAEAEVRRNIDAALLKLSKKIISYWPKEDRFCLKHEEVLRLATRLAEVESEEREFYDQIESLVNNEREESDKIADGNVSDVTLRICRIIDAYLIKSGEAFAMSVVNDQISVADPNLLRNIIFQDINDFPSIDASIIHLPDIALNVVARVMSSEKVSVRRHLKKISDTYTLYSFLKETPDVQKATKKIFGYGKIWLDTTIVLPLLAEAFKKDDDGKKFSKTVSALNESGIELRVTEGVVRELLQHIHISMTCSNRAPNLWEGRIPYLYYHYIEQGYDPRKFGSMVEIFHGKNRPEDDIEEYLKRLFNVEVESLAEAVAYVEPETRASVERLWQEAHEYRRRDSANSDNVVTEALVRHDVESYLGVLGLRKNEEASELGYKHWWLTIDSVAWKIRASLKAELARPPSSPLMSLDFLANAIAFGPSRNKIDRNQEQLLPLFLEADAAEYMPKELIQVANKAREANQNLPEHIVRRKVRDACDSMKRRYGRLTKTAVENPSDVVVR